MLSGIKRQTIVGKDGKIEIQTSELLEGTAVEVIVLVEEFNHEGETSSSIRQDETEYLLSTEANRDRLMAAMQSIEHKTGLASFTADEWGIVVAKSPS